MKNFISQTFWNKKHCLVVAGASESSRNEGTKEEENNKEEKAKINSK
jgi:hypothetical protein